MRVLTCALTCPIHGTNPTDIPFPGASLRTPGDRQHVDKQAFPWHPSTKGQTTQRTDKYAEGLTNEGRHHLLFLHKQVHDKRGIEEPLYAYITRAKLTACEVGVF